MNDWQRFISSLEFDSNRLKFIDTTLVGYPKVPLYFYLDYLNHSEFSGNKVRKLYGTLENIKDSEYDTIITVGGNFSNYLYACSFIPRLFGIKLVTIIKGHEPKEYGLVLNQLRSVGADIYFYPREMVRDQLPELISELQNRYPNSYFVPEGGSNEYAHEGFRPLCMSPLNTFDIVCTPVGTGGTFLGLKHYLSPHQKLYGYAAHKDYSLKDIGEISFDYSFGGFAKWSNDLIEFKKKFEDNYQIPLDRLYTAKMMFGIFHDIQSGKLDPNKSIVAIHTGGIYE